MDTEQLVTDKSLPVGIEFYTYFVLTRLSQYENLIPHKPQITCILQKSNIFLTDACLAEIV